MKQVELEEEQQLSRLLAQEPLAPGATTLRDHGPSAADLDALASQLALRGLNVNARAGRGPALSKWGAGAVGGVATAVVCWVALRGTQPAAPHTAPAARSALTSPAVQAPQPPRSASGRAATAQGGGRPSPPAQARLEDPSDERPIGAVEQRGSGTSLREVKRLAANPANEARSAAADPERNLPLSAPKPPFVATPAVTSTPPSGAPPSGSSPSGSSPSGSSVSVAGTAEAPSEIELLREARLALRQSPARALQLSEEHARLYPRGKLAQERELIAVSALVALGRRTAALSRAATFERLNPASPYRKQMGDLLR